MQTSSSNYLLLVENLSLSFWDDNLVSPRFVRCHITASPRVLKSFVHPCSTSINKRERLVVGVLPFVVLTMSTIVPLQSDGGRMQADKSAHLVMPNRKLREIRVQGLLSRKPSRKVGRWERDTFQIFSPAKSNTPEVGERARERLLPAVTNAEVKLEMSILICLLSNASGAIFQQVASKLVNTTNTTNTS